MTREETLLEELRTVERKIQNLETILKDSINRKIDTTTPVFTQLKQAIEDLKTERDKVWSALHTHRQLTAYYLMGTMIKQAMYAEEFREYEEGEED